MCGRYAIISVPELIRALLRYVEHPNFPPRYNVAPTQPVPVVRLTDGVRHFALVRWGLLPSWVKDPKSFSLLINARGETAAEKPAFRAAMKRRRCLLPADGFYEWQRDGERKRPFFIRQKSEAPFAMAGLWETWTGPNGEELESAAIVTTAANETLRPIHDRMPVIVPPELFDLWLDTAVNDEKAASAVIAPAPDDLLTAYEISTAVNRVANDSADNIVPLRADTAPVQPAPKPEKKPKAKAAKRRPAKDEGQSSLF